MIFRSIDSILSYNIDVISILLGVINGNTFDVIVKNDGNAKVNINAIKRKYLVVVLFWVICLRIGTEMYIPTIINRNQK